MGRPGRQLLQLQLRYKYSGDNFRSDLTAGCLFANFIRMFNVDFKHLVTIIGPVIAKKDTTICKTISIQDRLIITLWFLAILGSGDPYDSLMYLLKFQSKAYVK